MGRAVFVCFLLCGLALAVFANKVHDKIYTGLSGRTSCNRLMNDRQEIGCQSPRKGASGVLFKITTTADIPVLLYSVPKDEYIPLVAYSVFSQNASLSQLLNSDLVKGILVYDDQTGLNFSPDNIMPNFEQGLPFPAQSYTPVSWNAVGGGFNRNYANYTEGLMFLDFGLPIFYLTAADNATVFSCYNSNNVPVNGQQPSYPLCAIELNSFMWGAGDTPTCMRRALCDPLSNQSPYGYLHPPNSTEEVVMVTAQVDSSAFFHDLSFGAESDGSGLIVALAAAELLGRPVNNASRALGRNIMFSLFHGEAFGYIGSSRMANDMSQSGSPFPLSKVSHMIELNQLALSSADQLYLHAFNPAGTKVQEVKDALISASTSLTGPTINAPTATQLPPASLRAFLQEMNTTSQQSFGGVVLAAYDDSGFDNVAYHSHLDVASNINYADSSSAVVTRLCKLAAVVAQSAWMLAGSITGPFSMPNSTADCAFVASLLQCITKDQNCSLAQTMVGTLGTAGQPLSRYIGVAGGGLDKATLFLLDTLAYALAYDRNASIDSGSCVPVNKPPNPQYYKLNSGTCVYSTTFSWPALSPAFYPDGSNLRPSYSSRFSTWTEARWGSVSMRVFLVDSPSAQATILGGGVVMLVFSFALVFLLQKILVVTPRQ